MIELKTSKYKLGVMRQTLYACLYGEASWKLISF